LCCCQYYYYCYCCCCCCRYCCCYYYCHCCCYCYAMHPLLFGSSLRSNLEKHCHSAHHCQIIPNLRVHYVLE
jgi:hypothetical protein